MISPRAAAIAANLRRVRERMADAARRAGRDPAAARLVAVTKYVDADTARLLGAAGCRDLGESRPQELCAKAEALRGLPITWHLIGHLQRNKVRRTLAEAAWIHSADSPRLLDALEDEAARAGAVQAGARPRVLIEVNISGEPAKTGLPPDDLAAIFEHLPRWPHLEVRGLMGMAAEGDAERARREFTALAETRRIWQEKLERQGAAAPALPELSMGMSGDFEAAIEAGATMVRVGSALFEGLPP